jgi:serine protease AprX
MVLVDRLAGSPPGRDPTERGWSLDFLRSGRIAATLSALLLVAGIAPAAALAATYDPATDPYSMAATTASTGATAWWNAGYTGAGIDVALIDTGVSPVEGLAGPGKVIYGPDLSLESQNPAFQYLDTNGHGTFMAGLIAGNSPDYKGMAPDARIVSLKVGTADGGTDVSQVIAAIDWVVQHRYDNGLNIRVINLSYGTNSSQAYSVDPLAFAVEKAWNAGIFVVTASGNTGFVGGNAGSMSTPAKDPFVLAVGASDSMGTPRINDDTVAAFSATGSKSRHVDLVAPGSHIVGLRVPGSYIDQTYGSTGSVSSTLFRGSGTSEAAAIVSGAAALAIQQRPSISPSQLKLLLMNNSVSFPRTSNIWQGRGELNLWTTLMAPSTETDSGHTAGTGTGTLEASRGTEHLTANGVVLSGEQDIFGKSFNSSAMAALEATGSSWSGGTWNGSSWSGSSWSGSSWSGSSWSGSSWSGSSWTGSSWSGNSWSGSSWSGSSWSGSSWSGSSWSGNSWSTGSWD